MSGQLVHVFRIAVLPARPNGTGGRWTAIAQPTIESPLPGDLVICPRTAPRAESCYAVAVWPDLEQVGTEYQSYGYALLRAREQARVKAVAVWRNHSLDFHKTALENVTTE